MTAILRLARSTGLITAEVFEALFARELGARFEVRRADPAAWTAEVLGPRGAPRPLERAAEAFAAAARGVDFVCPSYEAFALSPLLAALRNRAGSPARLLLIAHAPGAYLLEWALLAPLLAPGDVIVAPSRSAARMIGFLAPALEPFVRVVPHPMAPLPSTETSGDDGRRRVVSLGRIHPSKLAHRQIEAMAVLRERGVPLPRMEIAGPLSVEGVEVPHPYARALAEKIRRLGLEDDVHLVGEIRGDPAKARFLAGAAALLNLSVTVEESFGKSPVEALGMGVPVIVTAWNGLPETAGEGGVLVPVRRTDPPLAVDASAEDVADALERALLDPPSADACRREAERFAPAAVLARYQAVLEEARASVDALPAWPADDLSAAPRGGLLGSAAPLTALRWSELFAWHVDAAESTRDAWEGAPPPAAAPLAERVRGVLLLGTKAAMEEHLAGLAPEPGWSAAHASLPASVDGDASFEARLAMAAAAPGVPGTRLAALVEVRAGGRGDLLAPVIEALRGAGAAGPGVEYLRAEALALFGDVEGAWDVSEASLRAAGAGEHDAVRVRQAAAMARRAGFPARGLPLLAAWLNRFPDAPDAGPLWLDRAVTATALPGHLDEARASLERARAQLGELEPIVRLGRALAARSLAEAA